MFDVLVIGGGPAALSMAAALCGAGLQVQGLAPHPPSAPWPNTYGIWEDELETLGLSHLLGHRWQNCVAYFGSQALALPRVYGLIDKAQLQDHLLAQCQRGGVVWHQGFADSLEHDSQQARVTTQAGAALNARVVVDASGHKPIFVRRPQAWPVAYQAAYGIVGRFSAPPVAPHQFVLMDYRSDHLSADQRHQPPTFLYAMDLGDGIFFVEETSLAHCPAISFKTLEQRLRQRLAWQQVQVTEVHHIEHCLFPMNLPLPCLDQPVVGFGGAASMVHPATGYTLGAMLRRAPTLAQGIATGLDTCTTPHAVAQAAWQALWPSDRLRKHYLYLFGLQALMTFDEARLRHFFNTFFHLPQGDWAGFLADTLAPAQLVRAMLRLFGRAPNDVRVGLMGAVGRHGHLLWRAIRSSP
ncbi:Lycopene beta cyclase [Halomicronema hongdechloris C2206]|uniref:Lycopene beta cyclase n=1 Tax=Halomicronema hongdechloris C2206 TaxID=1641165 RepID=A0A1Z3HMR3_9CYAN|nr:lycopene cyclase family protein [Halomicronema hongdechloris]ASC71546.1 Lycopene beta cyclase [Halomicronema hongdechloris C2206]